MKLEELGISPTPWKVDKGAEGWVIVRDAEGKWAIPPNGDEETEAISNAYLIAAAPKLYDLAYRVLSECDRIIDHDGGTAVIRTCSADRLECAMMELRAALAEAAGEEVRDGK